MTNQEVSELKSLLSSNYQPHNKWFPFTAESVWKKKKKHNDCLSPFHFSDRREYFHLILEKVTFCNRLYLMVSCNDVSQTGVTLECSCQNIGGTFISCCIYSDLEATAGKNFCRIKYLLYFIITAFSIFCSKVFDSACPFTSVISKE